MVDFQRTIEGVRAKTRQLNFFSKLGFNGLLLRQKL